MGAGDAFCSYLPEAVRRIGLWDERFCNIGFQEADYFLRALIYNRDNSSINDVDHRRPHNVLTGNSVSDYNARRLESDEQTDRMDSKLITIPYTNLERRDAALGSVQFHSVSRTVFEYKWGVVPAPWGDEHLGLQHPRIPSFITYPYFEKDVFALKAWLWRAAKSQ